MMKIEREEDMDSEVEEEEKEFKKWQRKGDEEREED